MCLRTSSGFFQPRTQLRILITAICAPNSSAMETGLSSSPFFPCAGLNELQPFKNQCRPAWDRSWLFKIQHDLWLLRLLLGIAGPRSKNTKHKKCEKSLQDSEHTTTFRDLPRNRDCSSNYCDGVRLQPENGDEFADGSGGFL